MANKLRSKDFNKIGISSNQTISVALAILKKHFKKVSIQDKLKIMESVISKPEAYLNDEILGPIAHRLYRIEEEPVTEIRLHEDEIELNVFGRPLIKSNAYQQMKTAMKLPIVRKGALMPDSHLGYGLPIGGVLATEGAVIPYAIGMDIGCRMSLTIYEASERYLKMHEHKFKNSILKNTAFGLKGVIPFKQEHAFFDQDIFSLTPLLKKLKSKAARQLGSSGSGNHFVEWGLVDIEEDSSLEIPSGKYVGLLAHSGSRGFGASIAKTYSDMARNTSNLPYNMRHLGWLDLNDESGQEYWLSMNIAGDYAKACHDQIHKNVAKFVGLKPLVKIENHHNFAWKKYIDGKEMIVHRKGSTPAEKDELGIIPGSMTDPGYIVKGKGNQSSICSASHGAGRKLSRKETIAKNTKSQMRKELRQHNVSLLGGALDESPFAYKKLETVMSYQNELVDVIGNFYPRIVRMDKER